MSALEDRVLVARVLAGDRGAFRDLIDRHAARVHRLCYGLLHHHQDAEDAAQETFLRAYRALRRLDPDLSFANWLLKIATNHCRDRLRRRRRDLPVVDAARWPEPAAPPPAPSPTAGDTAALLRQVERAVAALQPGYREVFHLYHREGRSYAEMAAILGRPLGTIKTQLCRARRRVCDLVARGRLQAADDDAPVSQEIGRGTGL